MADKKTRKQRCYTYIRVSTEMQVDNFSLDAQQETLTQAAEQHGMQIIRNSGTRANRERTPRAARRSWK